MLIQNKNKTKKKFKRSQLLLIGSLLVFAGVVILSYGKLRMLKEFIYENVRLSMIADKDTSKKKEKKEVKVEENTNSSEPIVEEVKPKVTIKYDYIGYLEIPKIGLKRGFVDINSKYNDIKYNIKISELSNMPDVESGNFILYAHSGDAYISFFAYLYKLNIGDHAYVTYNNIRYDYELVKIQNVDKTGTLEINRPNRYTKELTLITCTKDSDTLQTVYYFDIR